MELGNIFKDLDKTFLLKSLNIMQNAFSVYDENLRLIYANESYCRNMFIENLEDMLGKTIEEIEKICGVRVFSMQANKEKLALPIVLKYGVTLVDWEVKLYKENDPKQTKMVLFDMYPILDDEGKVRGVVEVSHSRHSDMHRAKKMLGFTAQYTFENILGESDKIKEMIRQAVQFAQSDFSLHIYGESGVGKELFAQAVHNASDFRNGPFVALNCASFPDNLIESELFGYVAGAFTGASKNGQMSKFELADGGTLFLDEIGELQMPFQAKLLRVLETNTVTRIGSSASIPFNVRIISATNRKLEKMVEAGTFRRDLYYRLQVLRLEIPPLRERGRDVMIIADRILENSAKLNGKKKLEFSPEAEAEMLQYDWPGNIRELKNALNRLTVLSQGGVITAEDLGAALYCKPQGENIRNLERIENKGDILGNDPENVLKNLTEALPEALSPEEVISAKMKEVELANIRLIKKAVELANGNKNEAAALLGVSRKTIYNLLHKYNLEI